MSSIKWKLKHPQDFVIFNEFYSPVKSIFDLKECTLENVVLDGWYMYCDLSGS